MAARSGKDYIESLRKNQPTVYFDGRLVEDVTTEPAFAGALQSVAEQYDLQLDERYRHFALYESPSSGELVSTSFMIPRSREDLTKKRQQFKLRADHNFGFMGRSPDFMNAFVTGWYLRADTFGTIKPQFADNARNYYEFVRENDLFLTHVLINPQTDRSKTSAEQADPFLHLGKVRETSEGIIVRGAKMLGTMAPITEELAVIPFGGVAPGDDNYALVFAIPTNAPGLKFICREPMAPPPRSEFDHPLSSRFEEMDCIAIFDDVLVPWDRVLADGSPGSREVVNAGGQDPRAAGRMQTASREVAAMEFFCGLATKLADAIGITGFLHVQEKLGDMLSNLEIVRALYYGAEAMGSEAADGYWQFHLSGLAPFHWQNYKIHARFVEIVKTLAAGGFFYAPTEKDFANPDIRPLIDRYVTGRPGIGAEERVRLFKLAWDAAGDSFGSRVEQYTHFYSGDPIRNVAGYYVGYDKEPLFDVVDRALAGRAAALDIPVSPEDPRVLPPRRTPREGMTGTYPLSSHPSSPSR
jgi:4-hydroxyphenylacetate 3-monooxygenase oxygenase component